MHVKKRGKNDVFKLADGFHFGVLFSPTWYHNCKWATICTIQFTRKVGLGAGLQAELAFIPFLTMSFIQNLINSNHTSMVISLQIGTHNKSSI